MVGLRFNHGLELCHLIPFIDLLVPNTLHELICKSVLDAPDGESRKFVRIVKRQNSLPGSPVYLYQSPSTNTHRRRGGRCPYLC